VTPGSRLIILGAMVTAAVSVLSAQQTVNQPPPQPAPPRPPFAEEVFKNIQVLKGISVNQFMETMGFFSASLGADCTFCHATESGGSWEKYADDNQHKRTARGMVTMMTAINRDNFGGRQVVTCYTCHRGGDRPKVTPSLAALYGAAPLDEQDDSVAPASAGVPTAAQVLDKYISAIGGPKAAGITSLAAKGTYEAYTDRVKHPVEVFARAPGQRATIVHAPDGDITTTCDGRSAWIAAPINERPVPVLALSGSDLDAARLEAQLSFPARIKQAFTRWRAGSPGIIDDRDVEVVQGSAPGRAPATFFFDKESGLLVRVVRYADSPVGRIPMQTDYADYREVSGVKMPFRWTSTWLDGRSTVVLSEVKTNVPIAPSAFAKPAAPK
jgi:photosynthetic reaction center cytochrome c subunit